MGEDLSGQVARSKSGSDWSTAMPYAINGEVRIHYELEGGGPPLMVHTGFLSSARDLYTLGYVDALKGDYQLVLPDPRGQGQSDKPHDSDAYGPKHRVADVVAVLDALGVDRVHFWGYSMGGRIGFDLAVQHPERLSSLILGGAQPFGSPAEENELRRQQLRKGVTLGTNRPLPSEIYDRWLANDPQALVAATVDEPSLERQLGAIDLPALIYCGDRDVAHDAAAQAAQAMLRATFISLPGLDHGATFGSVRTALVHVLPFLARVASTRAPYPKQVGELG